MHIKELLVCIENQIETLKKRKKVMNYILMYGYDDALFKGKTHSHEWIPLPEGHNIDWINNQYMIVECVWVVESKAYGRQCYHTKEAAEDALASLVKGTLKVFRLLPD